MFKDIKQQLQDNFQNILSKTEHLFYVTIDRDSIWEKYIDGFEEDNKQSHTCNSCKSFLRQYSGIVAIIDGKRVSIWDNIVADAEYSQSITNLAQYIHSLPITDVFVSETAKCGVDKNFDSVRQLTWEHFHIVVPKKYVHRADALDSLRGQKRTNKEMLQRALSELTTDSVETVLDLIAQNSLYRGKEFQGILMSFSKLQKEYNNISDVAGYSDLVDNFFWLKSLEVPESLCRVRNSAIGTLLVNLSEEMDLDTAVSKFEQVVAPANYKRPTALITPKMVEQAKEKLQELGLVDSLERRYANETDLSVEDIIYTDKSSSVTDVFADMAKDTLVNPKSLSKVEEISIKDFVEKVVPTSKSIEVLLENSHLNNMVSLITSQNPDAKSLFKWDNNFSWSYTGGITDSIKERVKQAGGNVDGVLRFSIQWNDEDTPGIVDLDAHAYEPNGTHINFSSYKGTGRRTTMSGNLDVDMISPSGPGVENITWDNAAYMKPGIYRFAVHNYNSARNTGFKAQIEFNGEIYDFHYPRHLNGTIDVAAVELRNGVFTIKSFLESNSSISSKTKWGVKTNQFTKVKKIMYSPNHWENPTGNKHYMLFLENCINDEQPRPFFNEFLKQEFDENRKVFEVMGGKMKIEPTDNQLSGVGFSETQRNHLFVKVDGNFKRTLKVNF